MDRHSEDRLKKIYERIPTELKAPALAMLRGELGDTFVVWMAERVSQYSKDWYLPNRWHFEGGMAIRNLLRERGYGERYFGVENLDDIYIELIEEALDRHSENSTEACLSDDELARMMNESYQTVSATTAELKSELDKAKRAILGLEAALKRLTDELE